MRILQSNPDVDILEYPVHKYYESPRGRVVSFKSEKISGNENVFNDWIKREGYEHCYAWNKIYRADMFMFIRYPEGEVFEDTLITPMLIAGCNTIYYSDAGFYYYYDNEGGICNKHSFNSYFFLFRNLVTLYEKCAAIPELKQQSNRILLRCMDNLIDLRRCADCDKKGIAEANALVNKHNIDISTLYNMELDIKQKIKYTPFALFGARIFSWLLSIGRKKLN